MSYQDFTAKFGVVDTLATVVGKDLMGMKLKAPLTKCVCRCGGKTVSICLFVRLLVCTNFSVFFFFFQKKLNRRAGTRSSTRCR